MRVAPTSGAVNTGFPRFFTFGYSVSAYKFFLCVGIYVGTLTTAALAGAASLRYVSAWQRCPLRS
jgi:hypothetical protein